MSSTNTIITKEYVQGAINTLLTLVRAEMDKEFKRIDRRLKKFEKRLDKINNDVKSNKKKQKAKSPAKVFVNKHSNQELCELIHNDKQSMLDNIKALSDKRYSNVNKLFNTLYGVTLNTFINRSDSEVQSDIVKTDDSEHMNNEYITL